LQIPFSRWWSGHPIAWRTNVISNITPYFKSFPIG